MDDQAVKVEAVLASLRPMIHRDGGDIKLVKIEQDKVYVSLHGACTNCPASMYTLKLGIEKALHEHLPHLKEVIPV